jgi:hypothetical protein
MQKRYHTTKAISLSTTLFEIKKSIMFFATLLCFFLLLSCSDMLEDVTHTDELLKGSYDDLRLTGSIAINDGDTTCHSVVVTIATTTTNASYMRFKNSSDSDYSEWEECKESINWEIDYNSFSTSTVYAQFKDSKDNIIETSDAIYFYDRIIPSDTSINAQFGSTVSISSDGLTAGVSSPLYSGSSKSQQGQAYIYTWETNRWEETVISPLEDDIATGAQFSYSIALSPDGTLFAASAPYTIIDSDHKGYVNIYQKSGESWVFLTQLYGGTNTGNFGKSLSFSKDSTFLAVGDNTFKDSDDLKNGKVYIYSTGDFSSIYREVTLESSDANTEDDNGGANFGQRVAFSINDNNTLTILAQNGHYIDSENNISIGKYGSIFTYSISSSSYTYVHPHEDISGETSKIFSLFSYTHGGDSLFLLTIPDEGVSYSIDSSDASYEKITSEAAIESAYATIFDAANSRYYLSYDDDSFGAVGVINTDYSVHKTLVPPESDEAMLFGNSLSIGSDSSAVIIGAPESTPGEKTKSGAVYVIR